MTKAEMKAYIEKNMPFEVKVVEILRIYQTDPTSEDYDPEMDEGVYYVDAILVEEGKLVEDVALFEVDPKTGMVYVADYIEREEWENLKGENS